MSIFRDVKRKRFWLRFGTNFFAAVGVLATALQVVDVFWPGWAAQRRWALAGAVGIAGLAFAVARTWPRTIEHHYKRPNVDIRIVEGDLFSLDENLVIGVTNTFDTAVPHIISNRSVQGQFVSRVFDGDLQALDAKLIEALRDVPPTGRIEKSGKTIVYPIGTVAPIRLDGRRFYFCAAYSEMDNSNVARATIDGLWEALINLWGKVRDLSNGDPVACPVLGQGQSRLGQVLSREDSIRLIALSFMLASRTERVCDRLDIVVRSEDVERTDMPELKSFLQSLE